MTITIPLEHPEKRLALFGAADRTLRQVREAFGVQVTARNDELRVTGDPDQVNRAALVLNQLQTKLRRRDWLSDADVAEAVRAGVQTASDRPREEGELDVFVRGKAVVGRTPGQAAYVKSMLTHDLTVCEGPAGTGKTYLAVAVAAHLLKRGAVKRIVLARPAVEAGEKLGFLPGDLQAKVNPYLRPLFDALHDMIDFEQVRRLMASDVIEVVPLAFMRGRTLNDSAIILDESQNTTPSQMLMFLTRLGEGSKMIVTGDSTQIDLPEGTESGLVDATRRLRGIPSVAMTKLDKADIVRHRLVQHIVNAYADVDPRSANRRQPADRPTPASPDLSGGYATPSPADPGSVVPLVAAEEGA